MFCSRSVPRLRACARRWYQRPSLQHVSPDKELPGVFTARGLQNAWFDRADHYAAQLNKYTQGTQETALENIIYEESRSYIKRHITNYASLLYNLEFAMQSLQGNPQNKIPQGPIGRESLLETPATEQLIKNEPRSSGNTELHQLLENSFGSIAEFKTLLLNSALAISGEGFTWLVARKVTQSEMDRVSNSTGDKILFDKLFVLNTYNAGSPFNFNRAGSITTLNKTEKAKEAKSEQNSTTEVDEFSKTLKDIRRAKEEAVDPELAYIPLLAIDSSPKAWLHNYGAFGKRQYLENVWEATEWKVVESRLAGLTRSLDSSI
ncbi:37S ribosomal protein MRP1, mitochondrial [Nakaseomyces glabratus]|uniref:37S ribosomal protein MRP1, mitochondrial n=1 Tax=Candida glabrata TaxID=5478 RepID=A0A0W0DFW4_CANGB|nr:hypothetical protein J7298_00097 [Nakaseomyces glabratus]KAH7609731.1 hypothetical protein J7295_00103 [Nakaseomyces glabratus]KAH7615439.1 hypothetical protein J7292_00099 [Nakaseomyces glabratus]KTA95958.1 37S ribosomal protein MRP1, mitochondrial [Nakaseomyces glabratus]KTA96022.1 37S ribosomal protein MRP1, mitochondrial [Nakaseomyces glabratus]